MNEYQEENRCSICQLNCRFLGKLTTQEIEDYNSNKREIIFNKGETIFKQRTFNSKIIFVKEGLIKLTIEGSSGKNFITRIYGPHEFIGLTQIFGENTSNFTATAIKKTQVCMIEINFFKELILRNISMSNNILKLYNQEYTFLFNRLAILGTKNLHGRLAETLLYLSNENLIKENIYKHLTRKDLAELSAMSVESMLRLLNEFKNDKLIVVDGKSIEINDYKMIKLLSKAG